MKDSGIEWIGEIPDDWNVRRLKQITRCKDGERIPVDKASRKVGKYPYWGAGSITDYIDSYIFDEELILLGEDGAPFFDRMRNVAHYVNYKCWINNHIHVLQTKKNEVDSQYLTHFLNIVDYRSYINGSIINKLTQSNMGGIDVCYPAYNQQLKIANYINAISTKIDFIKEYAVKNIAKLKEYRQSIITEAVTKGLHDVPMKDSGIEWIGEIPEAWDVCKVKHIFSERIEENQNPNAILLSLFAAIGVRPRSEMEEKGNKAQTIIGYNIVKKGDIVVNKLLAWMGAIGMSNYNGATSPDYDVYAPISSDVYVPYFHYLFRSANFKNECFKYARGIMLMRLRTYPQEFKNIRIPHPSMDIQKEIAYYLDKKCAAIDKLIAEKKRIIDTLEEYKKSLIYECVTGKRETPT